MSAFGLNRFTQAFAVAVNDAGGELNSRHLETTDRLSRNLFGWGGRVSLEITFSFVYPFVGGSAVSNSFNLADPSVGRIEWEGGVIHDGLGIKGDGVSGVGKTGVTLAGSTAADAYVMFGVYSRTASSGTFLEFSNYVTVGGVIKGGLYMSARGAAGNALAYIGATPYSGAVINSQGLFSALRNAVNVMVGYRNGVPFGTTVTTANPALDPPVPILLLAHHVADTDYTDPETVEYQNFSNRNLAFAFLSNKVGTPGMPAMTALFTSAKQAELYTIVQSFQTQLLRQV